MSSQVTGPLAQIFGSDPAAFVVNVVSKSPSAFSLLCSRLTARTGLKSWEAPAGSFAVGLYP